jgi:crotonobetainyl-CoA:carnitine CoA-transferase CaiB-like acyl-CoA transferase
MTSPLEGMIVTELGGREAVGVCGTLLAQLGATVIVVEPVDSVRPRDKQRVHLTAGKKSLAYNERSAEDRALLEKLLTRSDVVITSSDIDAKAPGLPGRRQSRIVCDITAFGATGPQAGQRGSELQLQALTGIMDTTGFADGTPVPIGVPVIGYSAGCYAAASVLAALRVRRRQGFGQEIEISMFDAAFVSLHSYLIGLRSGQAGIRTRMGNRHPALAAWNLFDTADGHVLICAGSQSQWLRLCELMERVDLASRLNTAALRIQHIEEVETAIDAWTRGLSTDECMRRLVEAGVAAGPIATIDRHPLEANLEFRNMIRGLVDPVSSGPVFVCASPLALRGSPPVNPDSIPDVDSGRQDVQRLISERSEDSGPATNDVPSERPLEGLRVVEVGQYTTAPLCTRHLAHLGAEVIKIEKPGGDESRTYPPKTGDRSEAYCLSNADKRSMVLDLQSAEQVKVLKALLGTADVLVENTKPGTLAKFGLSPADVAAINPSLVYCAISGFGSDSMYSDRPGFDTVIQATSGFMSAVNPGGLPLKSGISTSDLMGAQTGIVAILGALEHRDRTGRGQYIDLSMQDVSCWVTSPAWNTDLSLAARPAMLRCADGFVMVEAGEEELAASIRRDGSSTDDLAKLKRREVHEYLVQLGFVSCPVNSVAEVCELEQTKARNLWLSMRAEDKDWPMLASPMLLETTPPLITRIAPDLNEDGASILSELGL